MKTRPMDGGAAGALILLLLGLACGGVMALSPDIGLPLLILLLPGLIYLVVDRSAGWATARAILLFQAAACVHPVAAAWYQCSGVDGCMSMLAAPTTVLRVWLIGGVGWLMAQTVPIALRLLNDWRLRHYRVLLEQRRASLSKEWGLDRG
jgi:hypothetical protein